MASREIQISAGEGCWQANFIAMGSPCEVLSECDQREQMRALAEAVATEAWRIEDKFSRYLGGNIVNQINIADGLPVEIDEETARILDFAETLYDLSEGRFDITSGVLRKVWSFDGSDTIPRREEVADVLRNVGWHRAHWNDARLTLPAGMEIDLGGVGKEYAVDSAAEIARQLTTSSCLVNFGGDLAITSSPARRESWRIGIEAARAGESRGTIIIGLSAGALATSGDARRFLLKDGVRYGHILDPTTGWPIEDAPASITVAADTCTQAGMLSTLAMLQGAGAREFLDAQGVDYWLNGQSQ
jgi:thiamine biosynthesis lipoprotein